MNGLSVYVGREVALPFLFFAVSLTILVWLSQSLRVLDVIINQGQSAGTFLYLAILLLPGLLSLVLPIALFCAVIFALHRLQTDSELVVMSSAGFSRWSIARPILLVSLVVALAVYAINLYFLPAGMRAFKDRVFEIRGDLVAVMLREGHFTTPIDGVTVYVRETDPSGDIRDILVHDNRKPDAAETYQAQRGRITRTPEGPRLVMWNGTLQRKTEGGRIALLDFDRYTFDLNQYATDNSGQIREASERFIWELLYPDPTNYYDVRYRDRLIAQGHSHLSSPLFAVTLAMIAMVALLSGHFARRGYAERVALAALLALLCRLAGVGLQSAATAVPMLNITQYLLPLLVVASAALILDTPYRPVAIAGAGGPPQRRPSVAE